MRYAGLVLLFTISLFAQETKPRIFVRARGTVNSMTQGARGGGLFGGSRYDSIVDEHDESIELTKELRQRCDGVIVTLKEEAADYIVMLNRESKAKRGIFNKNSQVLVADKNGDVIWTKDVRAVVSAAKDVCAAVMSQGVPHIKPAEPTQGTVIPTPAASTANAQTLTKPETSVRTTPNTSGTAVLRNLSTAPQQGTTVSARVSLGISGADWEEGGVRGVAIMDVFNNGSAQLAGLHRGDVIVQINGKPVGSVQDLASVLNPMGPGTRVDIDYLIKTNLGWMPKETAAILEKGD